MQLFPHPDLPLQNVRDDKPLIYGTGSDGAAKEAKEEKGENAGKVEDEQRKGHIILQSRKSNRMIDGK